MSKANAKKRAFTIVELIIVIAVIGILAAILIPAFSNIIAKANAKSALSDARNTLTSF
ncbi:MAG TPA: prepilin-type N-terminal cleavage/methylation domain-containing protein, partial [Clostridiales bacterium]|nr:prepilin-type N-terminal cleavage/methylation domain-containing protein [Clostridiales bacterium]